jgi:hypothetical protein
MSSYASPTYQVATNHQASPLSVCSRFLEAASASCCITPDQFQGYLLTRMEQKRQSINCPLLYHTYWMHVLEVIGY